MEVWILRVQVNGEWEECRFLTKGEALAAFSALTSDYRSALPRAMLYASQRTEGAEAPAAYVN